MRQIELLKLGENVLKKENIQEFKNNFEEFKTSGKKQWRSWGYDDA